MLEEKYGASFLALSAILIRLDRAANEDITSLDSVIYSASRDDYYLPETMKMDADDTMIDDNDRVGCTTALGFASLRAPDETEQYERERTILLKATVVLVSELNSYRQ